MVKKFSPTINFKHETMKYLPEEPEPHTIYISYDYQTSVHLCACGCGGSVYLPFDKPSGWSLTVNPQGVTFGPSVGNQSWACESHYYIINSTTVHCH